ncbi:MAG: hypothetical protein KF831_03310 [Acidobacteria bacterium]|nr:hypothetical protein [Acidobacteriota bacterium]
MKAVIFFLFATLIFVLPATGQMPAEKAAPLAVVEKLFAEMAAANPAGILALGTPENQLVAIRKLRDGSSRVEVISGDAFSKMFTNKEANLREEMYAPQVEVEGDYAMVYGRYVFFVGERLSHCGVNQFNLVKVEGVWKIANGASTIDPGACTEKEKAMKPDPKKWGLQK